MPFWNNHAVLKPFICPFKSHPYQLHVFSLYMLSDFTIYKAYAIRYRSLGYGLCNNLHLLLKGKVPPVQLVLLIALIVTPFLTTITKPDYTQA